MLANSETRRLDEAEQGAFRNPARFKVTRES